MSSSLISYLKLFLSDVVLQVCVIEKNITELLSVLQGDHLDAKRLGHIRRKTFAKLHPDHLQRYVKTYPVIAEQDDRIKAVRDSVSIFLKQDLKEWSSRRSAALDLKDAIVRYSGISESSLRKEEFRRKFEELRFGTIRLEDYSDDDYDEIQEISESDVGMENGLDGNMFENKNSIQEGMEHGPTTQDLQLRRSRRVRTPSRKVAELMEDATDHVPKKSSRKTYSSRKTSNERKVKRSKQGPPSPKRPLQKSEHRPPQISCKAKSTNFARARPQDFKNSYYTITYVEKLQRFILQGVNTSGETKTLKTVELKHVHEHLLDLHKRQFKLRQPTPRVLGFLKQGENFNKISNLVDPENKVHF